MVTASASHTPPADPRYVHTVGWWQSLLGGLGRISTAACRLAPEAPVSLCRGSLITDETTPETISPNLPQCPKCAGLGTRKWRDRAHRHR